MTGGLLDAMHVFFIFTTMLQLPSYACFMFMLLIVAVLVGFPGPCACVHGPHGGMVGFSCCVV